MKTSRFLLAAALIAIAAACSADVTAPELARPDDPSANSSSNPNSNTTTTTTTTTSPEVPVEGDGGLLGSGGGK